MWVLSVAPPAEKEPGGVTVGAVCELPPGQLTATLPHSEFSQSPLQ
jgi:hypothetical protein